ncbi:MAG: sulfatase-like hydrolase/transferase, partial [Phycisphaerae bacterium]|nr:sulfatase-like hydrolase/transferase [Phycisphaerae bacterium]
LIVQAPGAKGNGQSSPALVEFVDVYPTLCDLAGLPLPDHLEGRSLTPLLRNPGQRFKEAAFSQFFRRRQGTEYMGYAMRTDRYRFVQWLRRSDASRTAVELYDHQTDPAESRNLGADAAHEALVDRLSGQMWKTIPRPKAMPPLARSRPQIRFTNERDEDVDVFWLAPDGRRVLQGRIKPGAALNRNTTRGHRFIAVGTKTKYSLSAEVTDRQQTVRLQKATKPAAAGDRPNILVLMGDDWSWPHAGFLGDTAVKTPTFDRIAREGVVFGHAFVSSPSCTPSRMAVATGQWHWRLGEAADLGGSLARDVPVYPDILQAAGYHIGFARKGAQPSKHTHRGRDPFGSRFKNLGAFLQKRTQDEPFCFWYGAGEPHRPYRAGAGARKGLDLSAVTVPGFLPDHPVVRSDLCDYYEAIQRFDTAAGEMLADLQRLGELDNTIVVLAGDNGMPFPRAKATLYDAGTRVPLVIRWPKQVPGDRKVSDFVSLTDLAPTFLKAAGLPLPAEMTGRSLLPILRSGRSGQVDKKRTFTLSGMERHVYAYPARAIRTGDWLYIRNFEPERWPSGRSGKPEPPIDFKAGVWPNHPGAFSYNIDPSPTKQLLIDRSEQKPVRRYHQMACGQRPAEELYDLRKDPDQLNNVAADSKYARERHELAGQLEGELRRSGDPRFAAAKKDDRPNVLFISVDDLNDWIGALG